MHPYPGFICKISYIEPGSSGATLTGMSCTGVQQETSKVGLFPAPPPQSRIVTGNTRQSRSKVLQGQITSCALRDLRQVCQRTRCIMLQARPPPLQPMLQTSVLHSPCCLDQRLTQLCPVLPLGNPQETCIGLSACKSRNEL